MAWDSRLRWIKFIWWQILFSNGHLMCGDSPPQPKTALLLIKKCFASPLLDRNLKEMSSIVCPVTSLAIVSWSFSLSLGQRNCRILKAEEADYSMISGKRIWHNEEVRRQQPSDRLHPCHLHYFVSYILLRRVPGVSQLSVIGPYDPSCRGQKMQRDGGALKVLGDNCKMGKFFDW